MKLEEVKAIIMSKKGSSFYDYSEGDLQWGDYKPSIEKFIDEKIKELCLTQRSVTIDLREVVTFMVKDNVYGKYHHDFIIIGRDEHMYTLMIYCCNLYKSNGFNVPWDYKLDKNKFRIEGW